MNHVTGLLRATYGCTAREATLAGALTDGCTLAEAATTLGISIHTARTHLKRVFRKTGTSRQTELLRLVLLAQDRPYHKTGQRRALKPHV